MATAGCVLVAFASNGLLRRVRWPVFAVILSSLVALAVFAQRSIFDQSPRGILQAITQFERPGITDRDQELSVFLAMCGRETDAEAVSKWIFTNGGFAPPGSPLQSLDISRFQPLPWRETFQEIANREHIIIVMEAHNSPKHRQWIEQTLPILHAAGFRNYAAETLIESGRKLARRGFPTY